MNPILPLSEYIPDVEARTFKDGNIYLYGSHDILGDTKYCSREYYVFSSSDFKTWEKSELSFGDYRGAEIVPFGSGMLYAPDCIEKEGTYYLYFCMEDGTEGVAVSDKPTGPFINPKPIIGADKKGIDPAVFVDDDGEVYYYWGQFHLQGAKMSSDMASIQEDTLDREILTEKEHGFHEGASMRKYKGVYYLLYTDISRGHATCLSYATANDPLGPFTKGGIIIDNTGCDPKTWNNHGSMAEIRGQWYIFYHRSTQGSKYSRRVCVEPIYFDECGQIQEVRMSVNGQGENISAMEKLEAGRASKLFGKMYVASYYEKGMYQECLSNIHSDDWCEYRSVDFIGSKKCHVEVGSNSYGGIIEIRVDSFDGTCLGKIRIDKTGEWHKFQDFSTNIKQITGEYILYLVFRGWEGRLFDLKSIWFE